MNFRLAALAAALLASCVGSAPDEVVNGVAVVTQQQPAANWSQYTTFSVNPAVAVVDQTGSVSRTYSLTGTQPLVDAITQNMTARGYTAVPWRANDTPQSNTADLQIQMQAFLGSADVYYPGYCGWYPYYYCYPGWTYAGSYSFGTLVIDMADRKNAVVNGEIPLVWSNANYGILTNYYTPTTPSNGANVNWGKITEAVNRAFAQSPYIKK